jgi:hypothetical protein
LVLPQDFYLLPLQQKVEPNFAQLLDHIDFEAVDKVDYARFYFY